MIFRTYEERKKAIDIVNDHGKFEDLKDEHQIVIDFMYNCLCDAENVYDEYEKDQRVSNETLCALEEVIENIQSSILEAYVGIKDADKDYWEVDEDEDLG